MNAPTLDDLDDWLAVDMWPRWRVDWPEWTWAHVTDGMASDVDGAKAGALPFHLIYAVLVERSGLPGPTRAVLQHLARRCNGKDGGRHRRCWPKVYQIADRTGYTRRTVQDAIARAEMTGWLVVVRHPKRPSDYVLDVPDLACCSCADCRAEPPKGAGDAPLARSRVQEMHPQGAGDAPQGAGDAPPRVQELHPHLGSSTSVHSSPELQLHATKPHGGGPQAKPEAQTPPTTLREAVLRIDGVKPHPAEGYVWHLGRAELVEDVAQRLRITRPTEGTAR